MKRAKKEPQGRGNGAGGLKNHSCRMQSTGEDQSAATRAQRDRILAALYSLRASEGGE